MTDKTMLRVVLTVKRKIGGDDVEFMVDSLSESGNELFEFNRLGGIVRSAIADYLSNTAPTMPVGVPNGAGPTGGGVWVPVARVTVTRDKGKRYTKGHGGKYEKYGVTIWPEVWTAAGIDGEKIPDEGMIPKKQWEMRVVTDEKNKPIVKALREVKEKSGE